MYIFLCEQHIPGVEMVRVAVAAAMDWEHDRDWVGDQHVEGMVVDAHWVQGWRLAMVRLVATIWAVVQCTMGNDAN